MFMFHFDAFVLNQQHFIPLQTKTRLVELKKEEARISADLENWMTESLQEIEESRRKLEAAEQELDR